MKKSRRKHTTRPILPALVEVVKLFGEIHYTDAADLLAQDGVWDPTDPPLTPYATIGAVLSTSRTSTGQRVFDRKGRGVWGIACPVVLAS